MSEENKEVVSETASEQPTQEAPVNTPDNGVLVAESKKYRKRAQDAEARIAEIEKERAAEKEEQLKKDEEYKTLWEQEASKNKSLSEKAQKFDEYEKSRRSTLLELHPEDEREQLKSLDLNTLEYITNKINSAKANAPEVVGNPRGFKEVPKDWTKMDPDTLRENWGDIVKSAQARMKK